MYRRSAATAAVVIGDPQAAQAPIAVRDRAGARARRRAARTPPRLTTRAPRSPTPAPARTTRETAAGALRVPARDDTGFFSQSEIAGFISQASDHR